MTARISRTRSLLGWTCGGLLVATLAVIGTSFAVWLGVQGTAETVRDRTLPAILATISAKVALLDANEAAVGSFVSGDVVRAGPGREYQNQIALASQNLARTAELNEAGSVASRRVQVIEALLTEYTGEIEQADAWYRQPGGNTLGLADLWTASRMVDDPDEGVLRLLNELIEDQKTALAGQLSTGWLHPWIPAFWLVPSVVLLALLVWAYWRFVIRFQRTYNPPLIMAILLLLGVLAGMSWTFETGNHLADARGALLTVAASRDVQAAGFDVQRKAALKTFLEKACGGVGACGPAVGSLDIGTAPINVPLAHDISLQTKEATEAAEEATGAGWLRYVLPVAAVAIGLLTGWGLWHRVNEYRYRP